MIDEPEGRAFLQRRVGRLPEDFRAPVVGALVLAARELSPDDGDDDDAAGHDDRHDPPGAVPQEFPPRFGEDAPEEEPHQDRDQKMDQDENADIAPLALHTLIFAQRSGRVNYGESLVLCAGQFSILKRLWTQT